MKTIADLINPKTRGKNTICLNMVVRGEIDETISVLHKIAPYVDQVVVIHDGEDLSTLSEVCAELGALYYAAPYSGGYPEFHRRLAMALTYTDWVFIVDSDEVPSEVLLQNLRTLVNTELWGYHVTIHMNNNGVFAFNYNGHIRLFRITPEVTWSMLAHSGPIGLQLVRYADESLYMDHNHDPAEDAMRTDRNAYFVEVMAQRWSYIPDVMGHIGRVATDNPKAQEALKRCVG